MTVATPHESPAISIDGTKYVPLETYERVLGLLQAKLKLHVATLTEIDAHSCAN